MISCLKISHANGSWNSSDFAGNNIDRGIDMFVDCVMPTRDTRKGSILPGTLAK